MHSLQARLVLAASLALAAFLGLGGVALERSFRDSAQTAVHQRLQTDVYALLAAANVNAAGVLDMPSHLFDERLQRPGSGFYGQVIDGSGRSSWRSASELGDELPLPTVLPPGTWEFRKVRSAHGRLFELNFGVAWETDTGRSHHYTFSVAEDMSAYDAEVGRFRRSLVIWLGAAAVVLLMLQGTILRWSLAPLRRPRVSSAPCSPVLRRACCKSTPGSCRGSPTTSMRCWSPSGANLSATATGWRIWPIP